MRSSTQIAFVAVLLCLLFCNTEAARSCYSGGKDSYASKVCDTGTALDFDCQKFVCEGGRSPFVLRTCARKNTGCNAGPRICQFSGGQGSCAKCDKDNCNA